MSLEIWRSTLASAKEEVLHHCKKIGTVEKSSALVVGCVAGSYAFYSVLDHISRSGQSDSKTMRSLQKSLRKYINCGWLYKKRDTFYFPSSVVLCSVNYGSYGMVPRPVYEYQEKLRLETEMNQDRWFNGPLRPLWDSSITAVARAVGSSPKNLAFVTNITEGMGAILNSIKFHPDDRILITSFVYTAVGNAAMYHASKCNNEPIVVQLCEPIPSEDEICDLFEAKLKEHSNITLAIIDHITSGSAIILPVEKLIPLCRKYGVMTIIDGAHCPGQLKLDLDLLEPDFYLGNLHKWYYAPRGAAIIWTHPKHQDWVDPIVVSHFYQKGYHDRFFRQGTKDYTAFLAAEKALDYYEDIGGLEHLMWYIPPLVTWAMGYLSTEWGTRCLDVSDSMRAPFMGMVLLPEIFGKMFPNDVACKRDLFRTRKVISMVTRVEGKLWCRVSAQLCSTKQDYVLFAREVKARAAELQIEYDEKLNTQV